MAIKRAGADGTATGTAGSDKIYGDTRDNILIGAGGNDTVWGKSGDDFIDAGRGNDRIYGDAGDDAIAGAWGKDTLTGGAGKDVFIFDTTPTNATYDTITDFNTRDDTIALFKDVFKKAGAANTTLKSAAFWTGTKAHDSSDRIVYDKSTGAIYYDQDGTGSKSAVLIAKVTAGKSLTYKDFFILDL